MLIES